MRRGLLCSCVLLLISAAGITAEEEASAAVLQGSGSQAAVTGRSSWNAGAEPQEHSTRLPESQSTVLASCKELPFPPENGYINLEATSSSGSGKMVVRVGCEEGYNLHGPSSLSCLPDSSPTGEPSVWIPEEEYICLPNPDMDELSTSVSSVPSVSSRLSDTAASEDRQKSNTGNIISKTDSSSKDRQMPLEDIRCPQPPPPLHGQVLGEDFSIGGVVTYVCDEGYFPSGPQGARCVAVPDPFRQATVWDPPVTPACLPVNPHPPPPSLLLSLPDTQDIDSPRFSPRQRPISAGRLTDSKPDASQVEGFPSVCSLPPDTGPCSMVIPRFFFASSRLECRPFNYGGCDGNDNNFETFEECQAACR